MKSRVIQVIFISRQTEAEESDQTLRCLINTYLDTSSLLGENEVGEIKKNNMDKPLTVLTINPLPDEDARQATSEQVKNKKKGKEDLVEIMVDEGKVLFIPKMENDDPL